MTLRCDVLAVGTELLLGQIIDSNSAWIGGELAANGIDSLVQVKVGDNVARIETQLRRLLDSADAVIMCGGLGPIGNHPRGVPVRHQQIERVHPRATRNRARFQPAGHQSPS